MITEPMKMILFQCLPQPKTSQLAVLALSGIELTFSVVASRRLYFGCVLDSVDNSGMF